MGEEIAFRSSRHLFYVLTQEHLITLLAVFWGMAVSANMQQGITWHYPNCRNKSHDIMTCRCVFYITKTYHTFAGHTVRVLVL